MSVNVYIEDTRTEGIPVFHNIIDMGHRNPRTSCGKGLTWQQYSVVIPLEWARAFGKSCPSCDKAMAKADDEVNS